MPTQVIDDDAKATAEAQIVEHQREVDYDTKEYPVETVVQKYTTDIDTDANEIFVPDYQRDFTWDVARQSKFIESVIIGLPIPYVFVADTTTDATQGDARLEIVDGSQRIRTLANFMNNKLKLTDLEKLTSLNGFRYSDLPLARQRKFNRRTIRMIELTEKATEEVRRDIFERINTGSEELTDMEKRRGILRGEMLIFVQDCAQEPLFHQLVQLSDAAVKRREREEFTLRFFAYLERYEQFDHSVRDFLDSYLADKNKAPFDNKALKLRFTEMLAFVSKHYPYGFRRAPTHNRTSRIRFEAIAVGTALALGKNPLLNPKNVSWLESKEFANLTTSDGSNSKPRVVGRIEFVRDHLLAV